MYVIKSSHYLHLGGNTSEPHMLWQKHLCSSWVCACPLWMVVWFYLESDAYFFYPLWMVVCFLSWIGCLLLFLQSQSIWDMIPKSIAHIYILYMWFFHTLRSQYFILFFPSSSWFVWMWAERAWCRVINFQASWCHRWQAWILRRVLLVSKTVNYSVLAPPKPFQGIARTWNMLASHF